MGCGFHVVDGNTALELSRVNRLRPEDLRVTLDTIYAIYNRANCVGRLWEGTIWYMVHRTIEAINNQTGMSIMTDTTV